MVQLANTCCLWSLSCSIIIIIDVLYISAATSLIITLPRIIDADWTTPLGYGYLAIFVKNPAGVVNYQVYLEPMTYLAWGMVVVFLIVIPPFLYISFLLYSILLTCMLVFWHWEAMLVSYLSTRSV